MVLTCVFCSRDILFYLAGGDLGDLISIDSVVYGWHSLLMNGALLINFSFVRKDSTFFI